MHCASAAHIKHHSSSARSADLFVISATKSRVDWLTPGDGQLSADHHPLGRRADTPPLAY